MSQRRRINLPQPKWSHWIPIVIYLPTCCVAHNLPKILPRHSSRWPSTHSPIHSFLDRQIAGHNSRRAAVHLPIERAKVGHKLPHLPKKKKKATTADKLFLAAIEWSWWWLCNAWQRSPFLRNCLQWYCKVDCYLPSAAWQVRSAHGQLPHVRRIRNATRHRMDGAQIEEVEDEGLC